MSLNRTQVDWSEIPDDIKIEILKKIHYKNAARFAQVSWANYTLFNENKNLWISYYQGRFGRMDFKLFNPKVQYIAAEFFELADKCKRWDSAQILFQKFQQFLLPYEKEPWTIFYFSVMQFFGKGILRDDEQGLAKLKESFSQRDHRAVVFLSEILIVSRKEKREWMLNQLGKEVVVSLLSTLIDLHKQGLRVAAKLITYMYIKNICTGDDATVQGWLNILVDQDTKSGLEAFFAITQNQLKHCNEEEREEIVAHAISIFKYKYDKSSLPVAEYALAYFSIHYNFNSKINLNALINASKAKYVPAMILLADEYFRLTNTQNPSLYKTIVGNALDLLKEIFRQGEEVQNQLALVLPHPEGIAFFKQCLLEGNHFAAGYVREFYSKEELKNLMSSDLAWLQLAAQHGDKKAFDTLEAFCEYYDNSFAHLAISIIKTFGIMNSSEIGIDMYGAAEYRDTAFRIDDKAVEKYLTVMKREKIKICPEIEKKLLEWAANSTANRLRM